jgi:hypothetical protein
MSSTSPNTVFHAAAARSRGLAAAWDSEQIRIVWAADMPAPCCARLRHVANSRVVICNSIRNGFTPVA